MPCTGALGIFRRGGELVTQDMARQRVRQGEHVREGAADIEADADRARHLARPFPSATLRCNDQLSGGYYKYRRGRCQREITGMMKSSWQSLFTDRLAALDPET